MHVAVLIDGESRVHDLAVTLEVFDDRTAHGLPRTSVSIHSDEPEVHLDRMTVRPDGTLSDVAADLVVVPGRSDPSSAPAPQVLEALNRATAAGSITVSLCTGAFTLAAAGLLDDAEATTHWRWCAALGQSYPKVRVVPNVLYVGGGQVWSSAGVSAGTDLLLELIRQHHGARVAAEVARSMVTPAHRPGSQAQYVPPIRAAETGSLEQAEAAILRDLAHPWTLAEIARVARLTSRTASRHFRDQTGLSPLAWLNRARVIEAQKLLETTDLTVEAIAHTVGFGSADLLRKHFRRQYGVSPTTHQSVMRRSTGRAERREP